MTPAPWIRRPNVVVILIDDMGWKDTGVYGSTFYETPHIDALSAQGARFAQFYTAGSVCSPTRASIMTGKSPARVHITDWIGGDDPGDALGAGLRSHAGRQSCRSAGFALRAVPKREHARD